MKTRRRVSAGALFVIAVISAFLLSSMMLTFASDSSDAPVESVGAEQGSCSKGQLSTNQGCLIPPKITKKVQPRYPDAARQARISGSVTLSAIIEVDGSVSSVKVLESKRAGQGFEEASIAALSLWRCTPGRIRNKDVRVHVTTAMEFKIP